MLIGKITAGALAAALTIGGLAGVADAAGHHKHHGHHANHGATVSALAKTQGDTISDLAQATPGGPAKGDIMSDAARQHGDAVSDLAQTRGASHRR